MKIVFLSTYSGPVNRGIESWVNEVAQRLSKNHEITVFQLGEASGKEKYNVKQIAIDVNWDKKEPTKIARLFIIDYWSRMLARFTFKSINELKIIKPDIVIPLNGGWQTIIVKIFCIFSKCKLIWVGQFHDPCSLLMRPNLFIAISPIQERIGKKKYKLKTVLIPNGVDIEKFSEHGDKFQHNLKHPVVLFVGALLDWKNPDKTILAISKSNDMSLLMVGKGNKKYINLGEKLLGDRFLHLEAKFEDMPAIYRSADVFTLISDKEREAFGIVYIEAMASGLPIVATNDNTRKFVIGDKAGLFVSDLSNSNEYIEALRKVQEHPRNLSVLQAKTFEWDNIIEKYEAALVNTNEK